MKIIVIPEVYDFLENLVVVLYEKEYFGFEEDARKYVDELYWDITNNLSICVKKRAPAYFDRYGEGMYYAVFKKNKRTSWYAFFRIYEENEEIIYQIRYIANNHTVAQHL